MDLVFNAERIVAAPVRGSLVDLRTGEPVPDFLVQARGPRTDVSSPEIPRPESKGDSTQAQPAVAFKVRSAAPRNEKIVTGSDGRFESDGGFEAGRLDLVLVDHRRFLEKSGSELGDVTVVEHQHVFDDASPPGAAEIKVRIGPTYRFDVALPSGTRADDFFATFAQPMSGLRELHRAVAGDPSSPMAMLYGGATKPNAFEQDAPLREGDSVWARFRHPVLLIQTAPGNEVDHTLHVRSRSGHWAASARVSSIVGIYPGLVPLALEARGSVEGTVLDTDGKPVPTAWIQLVRAPDLSTPVGEVGADSKGRFEFKWLAEGDYEVVVETDRYEKSSSALAIAKGKTKRLEIRLTSGVPLGPVSGVLRSRTGQHRSKGGAVSLKSLDGTGFFQFKIVSYQKRQDEYTAVFAFEKVPSGNYELRLKPLDNLAWRTLTMKVSPPAEGLEFMCEDDASTFDLEFRAIDAHTGAPVAKSWKLVWRGDPLEDARLDQDWKTKHFKNVPEGLALTWVLGAEGYRLATGDETDIRTEANHRVIEAKLERGWGQIFKVTEDGERPIEGVELIVDGNPIGVTDAQGRISMNLDAKPGALEFRYKDWIVTWGSIDPNDEHFGSTAETPVYMGPAK
jgi:hypothetical protein